MLTAVLDSATKVIVNTHRGKCAPHAGFYMASLCQSRKSSIECHLDEYTASHWLKIYIWGACSDLADSATPCAVFGGRGY